MSEAPAGTTHSTKENSMSTSMSATAAPTRLYADAEPVTREPRDWQQAAKRGWRQRCPHCGEGRLFYKYLKTCDVCETCGEELHHHRADDAPPYLTIFVVGHIIGAIMLAGHEYNFNLGVWTEAILYPLVGFACALWFLPRIKGALIAYQWALHMHGFALAKRPVSAQTGAVES
ncbi:MAG: DUF983 domain-containing protein [Beijerinckiaceae bacterium]